MKSLQIFAILLVSVLLFSAENEAQEGTCHTDFGMCHQIFAILILVLLFPTAPNKRREKKNAESSYICRTNPCSSIPCRGIMPS
ncbi:hypothetical protein ACOSQ2_001722 [Xanthoceras sorbifolium]